jgi:hypothetical protein
VNPEPAPRNLVTDLQPQFPYEPDGVPAIATYEQGEFRYILQFEGGFLIGVVIVPVQHVAQLVSLLQKPAAPKHEVVTS